MDWPLLASLDETERREVLATARRRTFGRGEVVVREADPADSLHLVAEGLVAVRVSTASGENAIINVLGRGAYFGELSLLGGPPPVRTATIVALEPAVTLSLTGDAYRGLRTRHPAVEQLAVTLLAHRVAELSDRLLEALYDGLDRRLYRRLDELAGLYAERAADPARVTVSLTQEQLAEMVGGTRPSVNQVLQRLVDQQIVELGRGRLTVLDRAALARKAR